VLYDRSARLAARLRQLKTLIPLLAVAALVVSERASLASSLVACSGFEEIAPKVWVDPQLSAADRLELLRLLEIARGKIANFYGTCAARPIIIVGSDVARLARFGGHAYAITHYSLWGSSMVIGPDGQNEDVISHELAHPEMFERIGWWQTLTQMPTWFDEGLAMQFDHRPTYGEAAYAALAARHGRAPLDRLATGAGFFDADAVDHYVQARHDVAERVIRVGPAGVRALLEELRRGRPFHDL
jgi:hypothetical protein